MKCKAITQTSWYHATEHSNDLFIEADRLNDIAYSLLSDAAKSPESAKRFHDAKNAADEKRAEAKQAWEAAKDELKEHPNTPAQN